MNDDTQDCVTSLVNAPYVTFSEKTDLPKRLSLLCKLSEKSE